LTNPVGIWNLIDVIKGVFLSFGLIIITIIINAVNHKYNDRPSWNDYKVHTSGFICIIFVNRKTYFLVKRNT
jgi:intracellular septation protein A